MKSWLVVFVMVGILCGCGRDDGRVARVEADLVPQRIVCATPGLTEVVFALGAGDRVVGVSDYTVWPPEALSVSRIGGWVNPDRERLLALQPDVILTQGLHESLVQFASRYDIRVEQIATDTLADVMNQFAIVGEIIGTPAKAAELQARLQAELEAVRVLVGDRSPRRAVILLERPGGVLRNLTTVGPRTFLSELLHVAGGENVFADVVGDYPQISREALLVRAPEVIIELHSEPVGAAQQEQIVAAWQALDSIPAVRQGRITFLSGDQVMIPGARIGETAREMARLLHPEAE